MILRPYQIEAENATCKGFVEFDRQLVVIPTGGGKTILFAKLAERFHRKRNERTLILAHREELVNQAADKIMKATGLMAEVEKAERRASLSSSIVVASIQTLQNSRLDRWPADHFGLMVADEAHHALANQWQNVLTYFSAKTLGVTATPDRGDKRALSGFFQNVAYECTVLDLIRDGFLSNITIQTIPLKIDLSTVRQVAGDLESGQLSDALLPYLKTIAQTLKTECKGRKILVFLPLIETSKKFVEECVAAGISARHVDGEMKNRAEVLAAYSRSEFELLSNAMLLTEGYDEPSVDCVVILRPTKSRALYAQMVGRGTRLSPGKKDLLLLDFLWLHQKHNLAKPSSLIAKSEKEEASINEVIAKAESIDLLEADANAVLEREAVLARELARLKTKQRQALSIEEVAILLKDTKMSEYTPVMQWEGAPASPKQREVLAKFGVRCPISRGEASLLLDRLFSRSRSNLASIKQLLWLMKMGHPSPLTATGKEAKAFLDAKWGKRSK
ncbi:MAG: DEAD/DEAH box helicase [Luteolibacter sp.]